MNYLKTPTFRSEAWLAAVRKLPCVCCKRDGPSEAAHRNEGKGMGIKTDDCYTVPLCHWCHQSFDQGVGFGTKHEKRVMFDAWWMLTIRDLAREGLVKA